MTQQTPKTARRSYIDLAEALNNRKEAASDQQIWDALQTIPVTDVVYREILHQADVFVLLEDEDYTTLSQNLADALHGQPDFNRERFLAHALSAPNGKTNRRAWVDLAEAVRTVNGPTGLRDMLVAIAGLNLTEEARQTVLTTFLANTPHRWGFSDVHRQNLAGSFARLLEGEPKFDGARFIYHATSDSAADDDSGEGKWSFNQNSPEDALKVTIEPTA